MKVRGDIIYKYPDSFFDIPIDSYAYNIIKERKVIACNYTPGISLDSKNKEREIFFHNKIIDLNTGEIVNNE